MSLAFEPDLVILGASFAGVELAFQLAKHAPKRQIVVVDRLAEHAYIPLIHERLCATRPAANDVVRSQKWLSALSNIHYICAEVEQLDPQTRTLALRDGTRLQAKAIVVALGSVVQAPATLSGAEHVLGLKFAHDGEVLRQRLLAAAGETNAEPVRVVVVGGGISGVEVAGELALGLKEADTKLRPLHVSLVHDTATLLPGLHPRAGRQALRALQAQGIDVRLQSKLRSAHRGGVVVDETIGDHRQETLIPCAIAIWAAGIVPNPTLSKLGLLSNKAGWIVVDPWLRPRTLDGKLLEGVWVIGDAARIVDDQRGEWPTMKRAIEALWQAWTLEKIIRNLWQSGSTARARPHRLRRDFPHGVSVGRSSLLVYGPLSFDGGRLAIWFRRFLQRMYLRRYRAA